MTPDFISYVERLWEAYMQTNYPDVPLFFDNADAPENSITTYAVLNVIPSTDVFPINTGINAKSRNVGIIQVDVFTPVDIGAGVAHTIATNSGRLFKRRVAAVVNEGTVTFKDYSATSRGQMSGKFKYMMRVPYRYDFTE